MMGFPRIAIQDLVVDERIKRASPTDTEVWCLNLDQIEPDSGRILSRWMIAPKALGPSTYPFEAGTVLYSKLRPYLNKVVVADADGYATTELVSLKCNTDRVLPSYLAYFLRSPEFLNFANIVVAGAKMPRMVMGEFWQYKIPLPPLPEQRRIAAILDKADALRTKRREALAQLDRLAQAIFVEMFGDPVTNPMGWQTKSLTDVCHCYSGGTPSKSNAEYWNGSLPWFSAKDLKAENLFDSQDHISDSVPQETSLKLLPKNTVVIVVRGMILVHTFPVSVLRVPATINQDLKALLPRSKITAQFLATCLRVQEDFVLEKVSEAGHGTKRLDTSSLQDIRIPQVPEVLMDDFEYRYETIERLRAGHIAALVRADSMFTSLQHRAFQGEL